MDMFIKFLVAAVLAGTPLLYGTLGEIISDWLLQLPEQQKKLFVRRYWFGDSLEQLSREFELPKGLISQRLSRMRGKLKRYLEQQGVSL